MRCLTALILLLAYIVVFLNTSAAVVRTNGATKVTLSHEMSSATEISHAHAHAHSHEHQQPTREPCPNPHHQHSHELAVGGHAAHTTHEKTETQDPPKLDPVEFAITHAQIPTGPSLHGIFRPPIARAA